ncbi:metal-dependent transcriptional regulator [Ligilactobacillus salivarius]|uniref:metal-dependent transcriptional regulator n=1 Tax=Ligilactobacillus salivarius TaxID=1624 RepID=UPI001F1F7844|nr:metal-dependent transcriptional regulator [Ligilactobacillus salivarius]MCF2623779.1 metal-dependent transcriptional regulator [Ligilactobacillus salivarius]
MTPKKEDYLKIIFELGGTKKKVSNKQIAMSLNIAAGSVTEMVNKLVKEGLAAHTPYAGISLTDEGIEVAEKLVRRHRLWETFLVEKLDYQLSEVHDEAEVLEHVASDKLMKKLDQFLNSPRECPHGGVIPTEAGEYEEESHEFLAEIKVGETVEVDRFIDNHELLTYLDDLELKLGDKIEVLEHLPFEGPIKVKRLADGAELSIGYKAAHYIFVK